MTRKDYLLEKSANSQRNRTEVCQIHDWFIGICPCSFISAKI